MNATKDNDQISLILQGKTVKSAFIDNTNIMLTFTDGSVLMVNAWEYVRTGLDGFEVELNQGDTE